MFHLHVQEMERMRQKRTFPMPKVQPGDLVEVKYELSRSQQTFAVFQGFCIEVRNKFLNSGFVLKNTYDGVGVEQLVPRYSPRVRNVRVVRALLPRSPQVDPRPATRNYRHMWHYYVRGKYSKGKRMLWRFHTPQRPGIMSLEPRIRRELNNIRRRYQMQRVEAQLPPYIFPGPYNLTRRQTREVKAERFRRMLIYAWDERQQREAKKKRLKDKHKWGTYKIDKEPTRTALSELPAYHPLSENLPK
jgi:ribosomal protein L19